MPFRTLSSVQWFQLLSKSEILQEFLHLNKILLKQFRKKEIKCFLNSITACLLLLNLQNVFFLDLFEVVCTLECIHPAPTLGASVFLKCLGHSHVQHVQHAETIGLTSNMYSWYVNSCTNII